MSTFDSDSTLPMSVQIDLEMFQWSAAMGISNRLEGQPIMTKARFMAHESVAHIGHDLKLDMYRAYRVGFNKAPVAKAKPTAPVKAVSYEV